MPIGGPPNLEETITKLQHMEYWIQKNGGSREDIAIIQKEIKRVRGKIPTTLVLRERPTPRQTYVQIRGDFLRLAVRPQVRDINREFVGLHGGHRAHSRLVAVHCREIRKAICGQDRPGILLQISSVLSSHRVNVEELASERISAPMDGSMLFQARATVLLPPDLSVASLRTGLEKIATDLMVDVQLQPK